ncbi:MAG: T9SS type A sorting domain-containing protein [Lacibacter sp.]
MKTKFYTFFFLLSFAPVFLIAQTVTQFRETFGNGSSKTALPAGTTTYTFSTGNLEDGQYTISNKTNGRSEWHNSKDHTGDINGRSMVINAGYTAGEFYRDTISGLIENTTYSVYLYIMNVNTLGTCGSGALLPKLQFIIESYNPSNGTFQTLQTFTTGSLPQTSTPTWSFAGTSFLLPAGKTNIRYRIINQSSGGCGNDLAIDDITFARGIQSSLPVTGFNVTASRVNDEVLVKWQTLSETNNSMFAVQKSSNGTDWKEIAFVAGAGNSTMKNDYKFTDKNPGTKNFYRIQQVDYDGHYDYSNTVALYMSSITKAATFPNPFVSAVQVNMISSETQTVTIRLNDLIGRTVQQVKWTVQKGNNSTIVNNLSQLPKGMYMLSVSGENGEQLYSSKIMK